MIIAHILLFARRACRVRLSRLPLLPVLVAAALLVTAPERVSLSLGPAPALAAADHTVLYYLIEMQRRVKKNCNGQPMPEAPSLLPSEALRDLAARSAESGRSAGAEAEAAGLAGTPLLSATVSGQGPQQAFDSFMIGQCPALMGGEYRYIGAYAKGGQWTVIMAAAEPGTAAPERGAAAPPERNTPPPGLETPPLTSAPPVAPSPAVPTPAAPTSVAPTPAAPTPAAPTPAAPTPDASSAAASSPAVTGKPARGVPAPAPAPAPAPGHNEVAVDSRAYAPLPPGGAGPVNDPAAPAAPIVLRELEISATGEILGLPGSGNPREMLSAARPAQGSAAVRSAPPGSAGPNADPAAPAAPIVVREMETGPLLGPATPGVRAFPAPGGSPPALLPESGGVALPAPLDMPPSGGKADGGDAPEPFVPPSAPGPFGVRDAGAALPRVPAAESGVTPLRDERASTSSGIGVFAPGGGGDGPGPAFRGTADIRQPATAAWGQGGALFHAINAVRAGGYTCGGNAMPPAQPLRENPLLNGVAEAHARDMAAAGYFSSTAPGGRTLGRRVSDSGYIWGFVAENIAAGSATAEQTVQGWLANEAQCANIMGPEYVEAGVGLDAQGRLWVFILATPMEQGALRMP